MSDAPEPVVDGRAEVAPPAILLQGIAKAFGGVPAVRDCDLCVPRGAFVSLLGPSGCGKTTLLRIIGGFERQDGGTVAISGEVVDGTPPNKRDVNTVFQRYALFPHRSVGANVAFPLEVAGVPKGEHAERVRELLDLVRLPGSEARSVATLSGGQAQRVALARALVGRPQVLLLDEPLAALDLKLRKAMQLELRRIQEELGTTFLYVTHDQEEALTMSDTVVVMNDGRIVQQGPPAEIYERPSSVFSSTFIGETNLLPGVAEMVDAGGTEVTVGGRTVAAAPSGVTRGDRVVVCVRPQRILAGAEAAACVNRFSGVVARRIFLGNIVRTIVELELGSAVMVESGGAADESLAEGQRTEVGWHARDAIVFPDDRAEVGAG